MTKCEICCDSKRVRLPVFKSVDLSALGRPYIETLEDSYRDYPCPECAADAVPFDRIQVLAKISHMRTDVVPPGHLDVVKRSAANAIVNALVRDGLISFTVGAPDLVTMSTPVEAVLGVVSPRHVATLQERVAERQFEVAESLVAENIKEIQNWGSHYHGSEGGSVDKGQAVGWLQAALKKVKAKYAGK